MAHNAGFMNMVDAARKQIREYTVEQVRQRQERGGSFHFVDVREDDEFRVDRARGAVHIGKGVIERDIETKIPDKNADIVLYCGGGFRSALAGKALKEMGYTNVSHMDGGIRAWREAGYPLDS